MSPYAVRHVKFFDQPISEKYLGKNKTWRGFLFAVFVAVAIAWLQSFVKLPAEFLIYDYSNPLLFGLLLGLGTMTGDAVKSFFKRKIGIPPGKSWMPFDQIDFVIGAYLFALLLVFVPLSVLLIILVVTVPTHVAINYAGYLLKLKKNKF